MKVSLKLVAQNCLFNNTVKSCCVFRSNPLTKEGLRQLVENSQAAAVATEDNPVDNILAKEFHVSGYPIRTRHHTSIDSLYQ